MLQLLRRYFREKLAVLPRPHQNSGQTLCGLFSLPSWGKIKFALFLFLINIMLSPSSVSPVIWRMHKALPTLGWLCSSKVKIAEVLLKIVLKFHVVQVKS